MSNNHTCENTDVELWREPTNEIGMSYSMPSIHRTESGAIGINVGGTVIVKSLREWHKLASCPLPDDVVFINSEYKNWYSELNAFLDFLDERREIEYESGEYLMDRPNISDLYLSFKEAYIDFIKSP